jgi:hypothetical protein
MCYSKYSKSPKVNRGGNSSGHVGSSFLRLCHWNVEGIHGKHGFKTDDPDFLREVLDFDIVCLTETHVTKSSTFSLAGFSNPFEGIRDKHPKAPKGSGGVAILVRQSIRQRVAFLQSTSPNLIWVRLKKEFFRCADDIFIGVVYASPANSTYSIRQECSVWEVLSSDVDKYQCKGKVMLFGDFNTRTGTAPDFIANDDDQFAPVPDSYVSDDLQCLVDRHTCDTVTHPSDRIDALLDICKSTGLRILNGRTLGDLSGNLTCHKWNGSSLVDYGIAHYSLLPLVRYFKVHTHLSSLSDHCKISLGMQVYCPPQEGDTPLYQLPPRFKWSDQAIADFKGRLDSIITSPDKLKLLSEDMETSDINSFASRVTNLLSSTAAAATNCPNIERIVKSKAKRRKRTGHKRWFDGDCHAANKFLKYLGKKTHPGPQQRDAALSFLSEKEGV